MMERDDVVDRGGWLLRDVWFTAPKGRDQREGWDIRLGELADTAQPEPWDDPVEPTGRLPVLSNYLRYTYARIVEEDGGSKLVEGTDDHGQRVVAFNTGLFTTNFEPVICLMREHRDPGRDQLVFQAWVTPSDWRLRPLNQDRLRPARYFDSSSDLLFDPALEPVVDVNHVLERMPERAREQLPNYEFQQRIMLTGAAEDAKKRVQMNWRLAVPQFYWPGGIHDGRIQLLLPLRFSQNHAADLALVVEKEPNRYVGYTALTVSMAYRNARLLARPESDWLWIPPLASAEGEELDELAAPKWRRVAAGDRCPACGAPTGCVLASDNGTVLCSRTQSRTQVRAGDDRHFWEHRLTVGG
jgi:hypothetical protein